MQALWEVWAYSLKVQKWEEGDKEGKPSKQVRGVEKSSNAAWDKRDEETEEEVRCFRYEEKGHKKWKCLKMKEEKREKVAPLQEVREKIKQHCGAKGLPP